MTRLAGGDERRTIGPKTLIVPCSSISANGPAKLFAQNTVTANTAPRAGQLWEILSATYRFPEAEKSNENVLSGLNLQFAFSISMLIGGVTVAEQELLENARSNEPKIETTSVHALGSLEPFAPASVAPGQSLAFEYSVSKNVVSTTFITTNTGVVVVNYNLKAR